MNDLSITGRMTADAIFTKGQEPSKNRCTFVVAVTEYRLFLCHSLGI